MDNKFVVKLEENEDGELILPLSEEIIQLLDWQEGDTLEFVEDSLELQIELFHI